MNENARFVKTAGEPLEAATAAMIMIHGRNASAEDILTLVPLIDTPGFAYLAPQAQGNTWYPNSFLADIRSNEPGITRGFQTIAAVLESIGSAKVPAERTMLLGFSQGACLSLEFVAQHPARYGGVAGLSGGLIGPPGTPRTYVGSLEGTPIFLGCSDIDAHIPAERVKESAEVLKNMGASVDLRLYPGMGHTVNDDEIEAVRDMMHALVGRTPPRPRV